MNKQHLQLPATLAIGKGAICLEQDENAIQEFINGVTIGNLIYIAYASKIKLTDTDVTLMFVKRRNTCDSANLFTNYGVIVGFLSTLIKKGKLHITSEVFNQGYRSGLQEYCQLENKRLLPLSELCAILSSRHGNSSQSAGYVYGLLTGLTQNMQAVKPRIPGQEAQ